MGDIQDTMFILAQISFNWTGFTSKIVPKWAYSRIKAQPTLKCRVFGSWRFLTGFELWRMSQAYAVEPWEKYKIKD